MTPHLRRVSVLPGHSVELRKRMGSHERISCRRAKVTDPASGPSLTYAELARGNPCAKFRRKIHYPPRSALAGKPSKGEPMFVTGIHQYTTDSRSGHVVWQSPAPPRSGHADSFRQSGSKADAGVFVDGTVFFRSGSAHGTQDKKRSTGLKRNGKSSADSNKNLAYLKQNVPTPRTLRKQKFVEDGWRRGAPARRVYTVAYIAHAPLEPRAAVAHGLLENSPCGPARTPFAQPR